MRPRRTHDSWRGRLDALRTEGLNRSLRCLIPTGPTTALVQRRPTLIACSNDYLGLAHHPKMGESTPGRGCASSRLISGDRPLHQELEQALSAWFGAPALIFPSGYQANLAIFSTVCGPSHHIASDALNHASIIDGLRLSRAKKSITPHCDPSAIPDDVDLIVVEGLFSMTGDCPPLKAYPKAPLLAVDEAHALGCIGPEGRGVAAAQGLVPDILIGTFGKALGASGAFVIAHQDFIDLLVNTGRAFIYTTAPSEPTVALALKGLAVLRSEGEGLRQQLRERTTQFRSGLDQLGFEALGEAHIVPILFGEPTMGVAQRLLERGILATGIRYPTVARGQERIRFTVSAAHTPSQIDQLLDGLDQSVHAFERNRP